MKKIVTVREAIRALGGPSSVAGWLGASRTQVCNWSAREQIPTGFVMPICMALIDAGFEVSPDLMGRFPVKPTEQQIQAMRAFIQNDAA